MGGAQTLITPTLEKGVDIRELRDANSKSLEVAHPGDPLRALDSQTDLASKLGKDGWIKVRSASNTEGYIPGWLAEQYDGPQPRPLTGDRLYATTRDSKGAAIKNSPSDSTSTTATVPLGQVLEALELESVALDKIGKANTWLKVRTREGINGWTKADELVRAYPGLERGGVYSPVKRLTLETTAGDSLKVRSGPGTDHDQIASVMPEDKLVAIGDPDENALKLGKQNEWIQVRLPDGTEGWCAAWLLKLVQDRFVWSEGHALAGLHGPTDPGTWPWTGDVYQAIKDGKIEAVKVLTGGDIGAGVINALKQNGVKFIMARLFAKLPEKKTPAQFVDDVKDSAKTLYDLGIRYFEVHNEPNLHSSGAPEGMWVVWQNGKEFGDFYLEAVKQLRTLMPDAQFGWPGLSPGFDLPNLRYNSDRFFQEGEHAMRQSDFLCMHSYWGPGGKTWRHSLNEIEAFCNAWPDKLIMVTEFSNPGDQHNKDQKGDQYRDLYSEAKKLPSNLGGLFSFVVSASSGFPHETWVGSPIGSKVGSRTPR